MRFFRVVFLFAMMGLLCACCGNDGYDFEDGSVKFSLYADHSTSAVKSGAGPLAGAPLQGDGASLNEDDFTLELFNSSGKRFKRWIYGEIKDKNVPLNIGTFTAKAYYGDSLATGFDALFYCGTSSFKVEGQTHTSVSVTCKMSNVKVAVEWGEKMASLSDYYVKVYRNGKRGSLTFTKGETRCGYIPHGDLQLEITLIDKGGNKRVYSPKAVPCAANDFITFTIDLKEVPQESQDGELSVSIKLAAGTEDKHETITVPATLVSKEPPTLDAVGFNAGSVSCIEGSGVEGDLYIGVTAPAYVQKLVLVSQPELMPEGWPQEVDLLSGNAGTLAMLQSYGLEWNLIKGESRYGNVNFAKFAKKLRASGDDTYKFQLEVTDVKGRSSTAEVFFRVSEASVQISPVPDYDMWSTKVYVDVTANVPLANAIVFEAMEGATVVSTLQSDLAGKSGNTSRYMIKGLAPSARYTIRANYNNGMKYTEAVSVSTESAQPLPNGALENWSQSKIYGGNGTFSTAIYCDFVSGWCTRNEVTTYGAKDAGMGVLGIGGNYGLYYRWHSGTVPVTGKVGNGAEISTMAFWQQESGTLAVTDRSNILGWVKENGKAYAGYLFLGTIDKATDKYTLGIAHTARPESLSFWYRYTPVQGDNCSAYAVVYDSNKNEIGRTDTFTSTGATSLVRKTIRFTYSNKTKKAAYITVFFKSGESVDIAKMKQFEGDYTITPFAKDKVVGSILVVDEVTLNY